MRQLGLIIVLLSRETDSVQRLTLCIDAQSIKVQSVKGQIQSTKSQAGGRKKRENFLCIGHHAKPERASATAPMRYLSWFCLQRQIGLGLSGPNPGIDPGNDTSSVRHFTHCFLSEPPIQAVRGMRMECNWWASACIARLQIHPCLYLCRCNFEAGRPRRSPREGRVE